MNQNGMQDAAGVPQQMGQEMQQQPQMSGDAWSFLNNCALILPNEINWKEERYRNRVRYRVYNRHGTPWSMTFFDYFWQFSDKMTHES